jgi:para-aminobenzoate synthetase component 1
MSLEAMLWRDSPEEVGLGVVVLEDPRDMASIFDEVAESRYACFLDSSLPMEKFGRHSFIGFDPYMVLETRGGKALFTSRDGEVLELDGLDPFEALRMAHRARVLADGSRTDGVPPFLGGGIGYLAYELGRYIERLPDSVEDDLRLPEMAFAFYDTVIASDSTGRKWLLSTGADNRQAVENAASALERITPGAGGWSDHRAPPVAAPGTELEFECGFTPDAYKESVGRVREYILAGDIYQANLSQRFSAPLLEPAWSLYRRLRVINAAPFSAYLNFGDYAVASSSPERFLRLDGLEVETRPIKGTSRRYEDPDQDERSRRELLASRKDRAELSMIVDLERNDLGRVCDYGSVEVTEHAVLESYAMVHHLVSTVTGRLAGGRDIIDLLKATFPGGSITGAPKIRSIEIIDELEPTARSVYTGAIGYLGLDGRHDLNIAIRTMIIKDGKVYFQVGGGIVADSRPDSEFQETLDKGRAMFAAVTGLNA